MSAFRRVVSWMASANIQIGLVTWAVAFAASLPGSTAHAFCRLTTENPQAGDTCSDKGVPLAWRRPCISFSMTDRMRSDPPLESMRDVADASFATWLAVKCDGDPVPLDIRQTEALGQCENPEYNRSASNANTVIFVSDWAERELPRDAFGLTLVWHNPDTGEIYDADMQINETLGTLSICNGSCALRQVDLQNVITHEAGHFLGLGHSTQDNATMAARARVGETNKRDLSADDSAGLCSIYAALAPNSCDDAADFEPDCGFSPVCMPPTQTRACRARTATSSDGCSIAALAPRSGALSGWLSGGAALAVLLRRRMRGAAALKRSR